jgi:molybdenum cofactor cytidylyltransferase
VFPVETPAEGEVFHPIAVVILAAGGSKRMGGKPKQLLTYQGRSLLRHAAETALESHCRPILAVLGSQAERLRPEMNGLDAQAVVCKDWTLGMGASIRSGIEAIGVLPEVSMSGVIITLCDQPLLTAAHLGQIAALAQAMPGKIVATDYSDDLGVPAFFPRLLFPDLQNMPKEAGAKKIIQRHRDDCLSIPFSDAALDIDTSDDYSRLLSQTRK